MTDPRKALEAFNHWVFTWQVPNGVMPYVETIRAALSAPLAGDVAEAINYFRATAHHDGLRIGKEGVGHIQTLITAARQSETWQDTAGHWKEDNESLFAQRTKLIDENSELRARIGELEKALRGAIYAIKGREHTGEFERILQGIPKPPDGGRG